MKINLRQAIINDLNVLDSIHRQNMRGYVEQNYSWNDKLFKNNFVPDDYIVLQKHKEIIGFLKIAPQNNSLYLGEIQIKCTYQNRGIGTTVLKFIIDRFSEKYRRIWLQVLKGNPAIRLYRRLGFQTFAETKTHYKMQLIFNNHPTLIV